MNKILITLITAFLYILFSSWGFYAHKKINESAVFLLPTELAIFYKKNIKEITNKAIDADKRCYTDSLEPPRHYIDINEIDDNIDSIPVHWRKATEKYTERKLIAAGIIPWQISRTYQNLVQAFKIKDMNKIIRYSADLGHYIAALEEKCETLVTDNHLISRRLTEALQKNSLLEDKLRYTEKYQQSLKRGGK